MGIFSRFIALLRVVWEVFLCNLEKLKNSTNKPKAQNNDNVACNTLDQG